MRIFRTYHATIDLKNATVKMKDGTTNELELVLGDGNLTYTETKAREYRLNRGVLNTVRNDDETPVDVSFDFEWEYIKSHASQTASAVDDAAGIVVGAKTTTTDSQATVPPTGITFTFAGHSTVYTVTENTTATTLNFAPAATATVADDEVITYQNLPTPEDALKKSGLASAWVSSDDDTCAPYCIDIEIEYTPECTGGDTEAITLADFRYETLEHNVSDGRISCTGKCNITEAVAVRTNVN